MATPRRYYYHGMGPFSTDYDGYPLPASRAAGGTSSLAGLGGYDSSSVIVAGVVGAGVYMGARALGAGRGLAAIAALLFPVGWIVKR
jgi:hypothetical protein